MPVAGGGGDAGDDRAAGPRRRRQPAHRGADARLRHHDWAEQGVLGNLDAVGREGRLGQGGARRRCRSSSSMTATGSRRRSTSTRPTGCGSTRRRSTRSAAPSRRPSTNCSAAAEKFKDGRRHPAGAWRPGLAGRHDLRRASCCRTGGPEFYKKAFIDLDEEALGSDTMKKAFDQLRASSRPMSTPNFSGRDWNLATAMVINGKAGMQIMGDWAKGEFLNAGKKPGNDFLCFRYPGHAGRGDLQLRPVRACSRSARTEEDAQFEAGDRHHGPGLPGGLQRGEGLGPGAHRRARHRLRRLRQEGHRAISRRRPRPAPDRLAWRMAMPHPAAVKNAHVRRRHRRSSTASMSSADAAQEAGRRRSTNAKLSLERRCAPADCRRPRLRSAGEYGRWRRTPQSA